jgi:hypothetical protein
VSYAIASAIPDGIEMNARRWNRGFQGVPTLFRTVLYMRTDFGLPDQLVEVKYLHLPGSVAHSIIRGG